MKIKSYEQLMAELDHLELQKKYNEAKMRVEGLRRINKAYEQAIREGRLVSNGK